MVNRKTIGQFASGHGLGNRSQHQGGHDQLERRAKLIDDGNLDSHPGRQHTHSRGRQGTPNGHNDVVPGGKGTGTGDRDTTGLGNFLLRDWQGLAPPDKHRHRKYQSMAVGYYPERPIQVTFRTTRDDEVRTRLNDRVLRVRAEFAGHLPRHISSTPNAPKINEIVDYIERWITSPGRGPKDRIAIGWRSYTLTEMELIRDKLLELSQVMGDSLTEPWPGEDKPWPEGRTSVLWFELYTQERLIERTNAIFEGALRVYNDIVDRWLPAFNKRHQMSYMLPLRLEGLLSLRGSPERHEWGTQHLYGGRGW